MGKGRKASVIALCGVLGALALMCLFMGGAVPVASLSCPMLASLILIPVYMECGPKWGFLWYVAVGILGLILVPTKECAGIFVAYGAYPIVRKFLGRLRLSKLWKQLYFNLILVLAYGVMLFVFPIPELRDEFKDTAQWMLGAMVLLANFCFVLYDILIGRIEVFYCVRIRPKFRFW